MTVYALIQPSDMTFLRAREFGARIPPDLAEAKDRKWVAYSETIAAVDPATEVATAPAIEVTADGVTKTIGKRSLTAEERRAKRDANDTDALRSAVKDIGILTVGIAEALMAKGVLAPSDVEATARQAYQNLKALADRLRA